VCDIDTCAIAVNIFFEGKEVEIDKVIEDAEKFLTHLNQHLKNRKFIVGEALTIADLAVAATVAPILSQVYGENERKKYGTLSTWFESIAEQNKYI
jgi:glutathione S-transferase